MVTMKKIEEVIHSVNIDTINDAKGLVNKVLYASRQDIKLEDGEYLISYIIGLKVVNCNNLNEVYGRVNDVIKCCNRPDLYEVLLGNGKKVLIKKKIDIKFLLL